MKSRLYLVGISERNESIYGLQKNTTSAGTTVNADLPPPPPLTAAGQHQPQISLQAAQVKEVGAGEILFKVSDMPPLQQYNHEYIRSEEGVTYMKL